MANSKFPTWGNALDGLRKVVNNPDEYERETGVKVDWQQNPISLEAQPQKTEPAVPSPEPTSSLPEPTTGDVAMRLDEVLKDAATGSAKRKKQAQ
jgi:hypothetical protein